MLVDAGMKNENDELKDSDATKNGLLRLRPCGFSATLSPTVAYRSYEPVSPVGGSDIGISGRLRCGAVLDLIKLISLYRHLGMRKSFSLYLLASASFDLGSFEMAITSLVEL